MFIMLKERLMQLNCPDSPYFDISSVCIIVWAKAPTFFPTFVSIWLTPACIAVTWRTPPLTRRALFLLRFSEIVRTYEIPLSITVWDKLIWDLRDFDLSNHYYELAGKFLDEMNGRTCWPISTIAEIIIITGRIIRKHWTICRANALVSAHPKWCLWSELIKVNLGRIILVDQ